MGATMLNKILLISIGLLLNACVSVHSVSVSDMKSSSSGKAVKAESHGMGILSLTLPELDVSASLAEQCKGGELTGIQTFTTMRNFFVIQNYSLTSTGQCLRRKN